MSSQNDAVDDLIVVGTAILVGAAVVVGLRAIARAGRQTESQEQVFSEEPETGIVKEEEEEEERCPYCYGPAHYGHC